MLTKNIESIIHKVIHETLQNMQPSGSAIIAINNEPFYKQSFGYADIANKTPMTTHTQVLVGSVTKQFTAVALLKALLDKNIQKGKESAHLKRNIQADLDHTVDHYLPKSHAIWEGSVPAWAHTVTLHQLLVHSSGLPNYTSLPDFENQKIHKQSELVTFFKTHPLEFTSGTKFSYSNSGYFLLGVIVQYIAGQDLDIYMQKIFFEPFEMHSSFLPTQGTVNDLILSDIRFKHLSRGYKFENEIKNAPLEEVTHYVSMQIPGAAGSLISSAEDLLKWNNALYSEKIIPRFLLDLLLHPYILTEEEKDYYGYGIEIMLSDSLGNYYTHRGGIPGFRSRLTFIPSLDLSIIFLVNIAEDKQNWMQEIEEIQSALPALLSKEEKKREAEKIMENKYPNIVENRKRYELMLVEDAIINALVSFS